MAPPTRKKGQLREPPRQWLLIKTMRLHRNLKSLGRNARFVSGLSIVFHCNNVLLSEPAKHRDISLKSVFVSFVVDLIPKFILPSAFSIYLRCAIRTVAVILYF